MRRITIISCLFLILVHSFALATPAFAAEEKGIIGKQVEEYYSDEDNKPGLMERTLSDVLIGAANFLIKKFNMKDVTLLVFGKNPETSNDGFLQGGTEDLRSSLYLGVFSEGMMDAIDAIYTALERFIPYPIFIALILMAFLLLWHGYTGEGRTKAKDYATAFVVGLISLRFGVYLWKFVATIVSWFTDLIWAVMVDYGLQPGLFLNTIWGTGEAGYDDMVSYRGFIVSILVLLAALMTAKLNYDYTMRSINLMILLVTFVACCMLTLFPRYRNALQTWWDQFVANMILPVAHALALGLFFFLLYFSSDGVSNWVIVAYLFGFSSIQDLVKRLLGTEQPDTKMGRALGFGTLLAMGKMFSGKKSGKAQSAGGGSSELMGDTSSGDVASAGTAGAVSSGSSSRVMSGAKPSFRNRATNISKKAAGFALNQGAKGVGAALGATVGLMAGKPLEGAFVGGAVGGGIGKSAQLVGNGGMWLGKKTYSGAQKVADWVNSGRSGREEAIEEPTLVTDHDQPYEEKPMQRSTTVVTEQTFRTKAKGGGVINEGVAINGGKFDGDITAINTDKGTKTQGKSNFAETGPARARGSGSASGNAAVNRGVRTNGGNFKGDIISDGGEVTGGVMDANKIKNANGETVNSSSRENIPSPKSGPDKSPSTGGKHYNYYV
ncbi:hypothetical protein RW092_09785 [Paenibacillus sp. 3LSP]|uniref:hypothetical protein n=1 Tax=Paenibacillus sp. 3LSP TaxID=2800795 RepID=UPI0028FD1DF8|nr:hypothetical protein [Paenibacillus sp. 3LSP]MDU0330493.1 hypothetical protein [Paenibacillus sp. 3LSP]